MSSRTLDKNLEKAQARLAGLEARKVQLEADLDALQARAPEKVALAATALIDGQGTEMEAVQAEMVAFTAKEATLQAAIGQLECAIIPEAQAALAEAEQQLRQVRRDEARDGLKEAALATLPAIEALAKLVEPYTAARRHLSAVDPGRRVPDPLGRLPDELQLAEESLHTRWPE